jgi:hypothetical protein
MTNKSFTNKLFWLAGLACIISLFVFSFLLFQSSQSTKIAKADGYSPDQIIVAVNQERSKKNISPLIVNSQLMQAASNKVKDMAGKNYFSHISPVDGKKWSSFIKESGYKYVEAGENLANGYDSVEDMVKAWMDSPTHRENILNPNFEETGMAIEYGTLNEFPTIFVTQSFGRKEKQVVNKISNVQDAENIKPPEESKVEVVEKIETKTENNPESIVTANIGLNETKFTPANTFQEILSPFPEIAF